MKCNNCGFEHQEQFDYCPNCGAAAPKAEPQQAEPMFAEPVSLNPAADKVMNALKDGLFLVLCILMSVSCVLSIASDGLSIINILITVFLWLTYADSQKGFANENHLRSVSGCVYANYVITYVACALLAVCGVLLGAVFGFVAGDPEFIDGFTLALAEYDLGITDLPQEIFSIAGWLIGFVLIIAAVIMLVFNIVAMRKIHRFAKSVYMGLILQNPNFENSRTVKNWLIFFGVCSAISAAASLASGEVVAALATGCIAAAEIIASVLIDKHFVPKTYYAE